MPLTMRLPLWSGRLRASERGAAMLEFALAAPLVLTMGGYGIELANYAVTNMRVSQITLMLADNASRIGSSSGQVAYNVREADIIDLFKGAAVMGQGIGLTTNGRITLTSFENIKRAGSSNNSPSTWGYTNAADDTTNVPRVHWQRCAGKRGDDSVSGVSDPGFNAHYDTSKLIVSSGKDRTWANRGVDSTSGVTLPTLNVPAGSAAMIAEVNYQYRPLFGSMFMGPRRIHYVASFIVRDQRDLAQIYNPTTYLGTTLSPMTCNLAHTA